MEASLEGKLLGELLSAAVDERNGIVAITNPQSQTVLFVDVRQGSIMGYIEQEGKEIVYNPSFGFISSDMKLTQIGPVSHAARKLPWQLNEVPDSFHTIAHSLLV